MDLSEHKHLEEEDAKFAVGCRLTEDQFLELFAGFGGYLRYCLRRKQARDYGDVPVLPARISDSELEAMHEIGTPIEAWARIKVADQCLKVGGLHDAARVEEMVSKYMPEKK